MTVTIGIILTIIRFLILKLPKKRVIFKIFHNGLILILLISFFTIGELYVTIGASSINFNIVGILAVTTFSWTPFLIIPFYEIFLQKHESKKDIQSQIFKHTYLKCPNCKYMCRKIWKKCPICESKLY